MVTARRLVIGLCLLTGLVGLTGFVNPTAAHDSETDGFQIIIHESGTATIRLVQTYDLTNTAEQTTFTAVRNNASRQSALQDAYVTRLREQAQAARAATGRNMEVTPMPVTVSESDDGHQGTVTLACTWSNFAVQTGNNTTPRLESTALTGFVAANHSVTITPPPNYTYVAATPDPQQTDHNEPRWSSGTSFDEFSITFRYSPPPTPTDDSSGGILDSFVVHLLVVIVLGAIVVYVLSTQQYP